MAHVSTYLNFQGITEEAFNFYKSVFGGEFSGDGIARFKDIPSGGIPPIPDEAKNPLAASLVFCSSIAQQQYYPD